MWQRLGLPIACRVSFALFLPQCSVSIVTTCNQSFRFEANHVYLFTGAASASVCVLFRAFSVKGQGLFLMHHLIYFYFFWCSRLVFSASPVKKKKKKSNHMGVLFSAHCVWVLQLGHLVTAWSGIEREDNSWSAFKIKQIWSVLLPTPCVTAWTGQFTTGSWADAPPLRSKEALISSQRRSCWVWGEREQNGSRTAEIQNLSW